MTTPRALHGRLLPAALLAALLASVPARADRRALSLDVALSYSGADVPAPGALDGRTTLSLAPGLWLGTRYALTHALELTATGFCEAPVALWHNGATLRTAAGDFPGTLAHRLLTWGAQAGARLLFGMEWRGAVGVEVGFSRREYSAFRMIDDTAPEAPVDYGLALPDVSRTAFAVTLSGGLEWAGGDTWSVAVLPRLQLLLGGGAPAVGFGLVLPVQFSWSWYL